MIKNMMKVGWLAAHWARSGEYISQVFGMGPLGLEYIDKHDDPRDASKHE